MMGSGFLLVLSGPSGAGKDTVIAEVLKRDEKAMVSVSMTTRHPRPGEIDGVSYYFVTKEEFERKIADNEMLEWAKYGDNYYGTPKTPIQNWIAEGKTVILNIEVQGASIIRDNWDGYMCSMFLMPPSVHVLRERLTGRNTETDEEIDRRLEIARHEISLSQEYDYIIVNDRIDDCTENILEVIYRNRRLLREGTSGGDKAGI